MTLEDLKAAYRNGNQFELQTGLSHVSWHNWIKMGYIPIISQIKLERITEGKLKADLNDVPSGGEIEKRR